MISKFVKKLKDKIQGKVPSGHERSGHWPKVRDEFLKGKSCAVCGGTKKLEAHHVIPFHIHPAWELDPNNLIPLCESKLNGVNCHLWFGHLGSFKSFNDGVRIRAEKWNGFFLNRP